MFWFIMVWLLAAELVARTSLGYVLPPPSVGADSYEFDIKVYYLEQSIRQRGPLDCLFVGDSMVNDGPDPRLVEAAYQAETGQLLHCFNFGVPALMLDASGPLTVALNNKFHPRLMIVMLSPRNFDPTYGATFRHVASSDWTQQNLGNATLRGWAVNSIYGYRYGLFLHYWVNPSNRERIANAWRDTTLQGFTPLYGFGTRPEESENLPVFHTADPSTQNGFDQLLQLKRSGVNLLIVDAPVKSTYQEANRQNLFIPYDAFMDNSLTGLGIPFWRTDELSAGIAAEDWYDYQHVNEKGVPILSAWLGRQLAAYYPPEFFK